MKKITKYPSKSITSSIHLPPICILAERIVEALDEFIQAARQIRDISDYLGSDSLHDIAEIEDLLNEFVNAYYFDNN